MPKKKENKDAKIKELTRLVQSVQADFENYRKRKEADVLRFTEKANQILILKLLPVLDSFELALKAKSNKDLKQGLEMIYSQFMAVLEAEGLIEIKQTNRFDPCLHEALLVEKSKKAKGTILEVFQKGYMLRDCVLRTAKVKVTK